jgi:hypothetical protein
MIELTGLLRNVIKEFGGSAVNFAPTKSAKCGKKSCKKGLPCRGSCIAANKKCKYDCLEPGHKEKGKRDYGGRDFR